MGIKLLSYNALSLFSLSFIPTLQCTLFNISMAIINAKTIIICGSSIDMYSSFDSAQITSCPYVVIDKSKIKLMDINLCM